MLLNAAKGADKAFITEAFVFDVFSGKKAQDQMGAGKKIRGFERANSTQRRQFDRCGFGSHQRGCDKKSQRGNGRGFARVTPKFKSPKPLAG